MYGKKAAGQDPDDRGVCRARHQGDESVKPRFHGIGATPAQGLRKRASVSHA
jgi:hypothetical protein